MSNSEHNHDLYEIGNWIEEHYSEKNFEKWIKEFVSENYGESETKNPSWNIKKLAKYLAKK